MVSMWPCNFSVKLPSKVIMPKRKRKTNEYITTKIQWYKPLWWNLELEKRSDIRSVSRIIYCLSYLVYCIVGYYVVIIFYTDLFRLIQSNSWFKLDPSTEQSTLQRKDRWNRWLMTTRCILSSVSPSHKMKTRWLSESSDAAVAPKAAGPSSGGGQLSDGEGGAHWATLSRCTV